LYGLEGSGKTTLLYKLKCPNWKKEQISKEMKFMKEARKDPAYHYEELMIGRYTYGIWDIPSDEIDLGLTSMFYKYLRINCVFFLVDARQEFAENFQKTEKAKTLLRFRLNEDVLRGAVFVLIYNVRDDPVSASKVEEAVAELESPVKDVTGASTPRVVTRGPYENAVREILEVEEIVASPQNSFRFKEFRMNVAEPDLSAWTYLMNQVAALHKEISVYDRNSL
jgi:hypothetical protein